MVEKITNIKERILYLSEYKGISKEKFFADLGVSYGNFKGKSKATAINSDVLVKISTLFPSINLDWLIHGRGEVEKTTIDLNSRTMRNMVVREPETVLQRMPSVVTTDNEGRDNIALVPVKAAAGYLNGYGDPEYIEKLPTYSLPNIQNGTFRMFQVKGDSMTPSLHDKSMVVGQFVENWVKDIKDDRVYVIVSRNDGIVVKRCLNRIKKYGNLYCKSDNRKAYPEPIILQPEDIIEVWEYKMHLSYHLPNPAELYDRVSDLEADMIYFKEQLMKSISK